MPKEHTGVMSQRPHLKYDHPPTVTRNTKSQLSFDASACPGSAMFAEDQPCLLQIKAYDANQHMIGGNDTEENPKLDSTVSNLTSSRLVASGDMVADGTLHGSKSSPH